MSTRREALGALLLPMLPGACAPHAIRGAAPRSPAPPPGTSPADVARDETYWAEVARAFTVDRTAINLNNAAVSPSPAVVQEAMARQLALANSFPTAGATVRDEFRGLRVSPNLYTTLEELDRFCTAVERVIRNGTL